MKMRIFLTAAAVGFVCAQLSGTPAAAATDPWSRVPALPSACYGEQDDWGEKNNAALEAVQQEQYAQSDINNAIHQQYIDWQNADPMAMAQRIQQAMMEDPENAQKVIEQLTGTQQATADLFADEEKQKQLEAEAEPMVEKYGAELAKAMGPADVRRAALDKKLANVGYDGTTALPDWAKEEGAAILRERDAAYVATCGKWWAASGLMHAYMKRYRDYLVNERTPHQKKFEGPEVQQYEMAGIDHSGYRTVADYRAAELYLKMASRLFSERKNQPRCPGGDCGPMHDLD